MTEYVFRNESGYQFTDISSEEYRCYEFPQKERVQIEQPLWLYVSASGGHRVFDASGVSHYVPPGWLHLSWKAKEGQPHFVK